MPRGMRTFDPARIAYYETENWVAYYQKMVRFLSNASLQRLPL
jgi:hypothetical protein